MPRTLSALAAFLAILTAAQAKGLLIPEDVKLPPLAMVYHKVNVAIDEQVAVTTVEQAFRNHTDRELEATYLFPVPRGASIDKFTMWIDGKETAGELLDAKKASDIYTGFVKRTQDPALLEYLGSGLMKLKIFPVPPTKNGSNGDVKIKLRYSAVAPLDAGVVEFGYPMKTDGKGTRLLEDFAIAIDIKSKTPIQSVYSPTHAIDVKRKGDGQVSVEFSKSQAILDKDFQLFYGVSRSEIGLTPVLYRPVSSDDGHFMLLISPALEAAKEKRVPRDLVFVVDTSGSMSDTKMSQAKQALRKCLASLAENKKDRFALIAFSTGVRSFADGLVDADSEQIEKATKWIDDLRAGGGTAILPALKSALDLRTKDSGRNFTIAFFTDGQPTIDETNPTKIVKSIGDKNAANTRIFTFGVGDDVNAAMLDQIAEGTRAYSTYVRPSEDIEAKATALAAKISHPVMTDVKLSTTNGIRISEIYPAQLPDLFHGGQLVVFGKYSGSGHAAIKLTGTVGTESKELVYEFDFASKTGGERSFIEHLWARRKIGFLLDQIRVNGESKELVDEVTLMAKKYGIATPYTSYLVVPDTAIPVAQNAERKKFKADEIDLITRFQSAASPPGMIGPGNGGGFGGGGFGGSGPLPKADDVAKKAAGGPGGIAAGRGEAQDKLLKDTLAELKPADRDGYYARVLEKAQLDGKNWKDAERNYKEGGLKNNQTGRLGVDLALASNNLRQQERLTQTANKQVQNRNCIELGGVWIDDAFTAKTKTLAIEAQSEAYFAILAKHPDMKDVFLLGNRVVWIAPSGTALVVDPNSGEEKLEEKAIEELFAAKK